MKIQKLLMVICLVTAGTLCVFTAVQQEQQTMADKLIRLHVVANSDGAEDQRVKLLVRDAVLAVTEPLTAEEDPKQALAGALPEIKRAAEVCLQQQGSPHKVQVTLGRERFPTRYYETFSLPAGVYPSLRVTIGEGKGKNWWCVAFPSICFRATTGELEEAAAAAGFTTEEIRLITEAETTYVLKFKLWELLGELKSRIYGE